MSPLYTQPRYAAGPQVPGSRKAEEREGRGRERESDKGRAGPQVPGSHKANFPTPPELIDGADDLGAVHQPETRAGDVVRPASLSFCLFLSLSLSLPPSLPLSRCFSHTHNLALLSPVPSPIPLSV